MAKIKNVISNNLAAKIICILLVSCATIMLYLALQMYTDSMYQYYSHSFKRGEIAEYDLLVNNSIDILDEEATKALQESNSCSVLPVFRFSLADTFASIDGFDSFVNDLYSKQEDELTSIYGKNIASLKGRKDASKILSISYEILNDILSQGFFTYSEINQALSSSYVTVQVEDIDNSKIVELNDSIVSDMNLQGVIDDYLLKYSKSNLSLSDSSIISSLVKLFIKHNVFYDDLYTVQKRQKAVEETDPVYISFEKGQVLLAKDRVITDDQLYLIRLLGSSSRITLSDIVGVSSFVLISISFIMYLFFFYLSSEKVHAKEYLWILSVSLVLTCVISFFMIQNATKYGLSFVESFIPMCFVPVLITMITSRRDLGFVASFIVGFVMSAIPGATYLTFFYCTLNGILSCMLVRFFNKRTDMFVQWILSFVVTSALTALFTYIGAYANTELIRALIGNAIQITGTHVLLAILLPILEQVFNLPTVFRLNELANGKNSLLSKLAEAAPGTYSHSKFVADLSENASNAIGANAVLAGVGGLYHDIGKAEHPEYFVENQIGKASKHEDLNPSLSVAVIKSHVKVGSDMAREAGLPAELIDIIANHHGNDIIAYFYNEAKKQAEGDDVVSSTDFSYSSSDIPQTKECAIVMLADSVEAAARTVSAPSAAKFTKLINSIVYGKIERGQLDKSDLSLKEIDTVKESFLKTLSAQYHNRIEYPDEEDKE